MGAAASAGKKRLFYKGVTISKYYKSYIERPMSELIAVLHMTSPQMKTLFGQFAVIDADSSGEVSLEEFYTQVKITRSRFVERVFGIFDLAKALTRGVGVHLNTFALRVVWKRGELGGLFFNWRALLANLEL